MTSYCTPVAVVDMDDVVAEFNEQIVKNSGGKLNIEDLKHWDIKSNGEDYEDEFFKSMSFDFYRTLPVVDGAQEGIDALIAMGFTIVFATATPHHYSACNLAKAKQEWSAEHFPQVKHIIHTRSKQYIHGDLFIDDNVDNVRNFVAINRNAVSVLYSRPWNAHAVYATRMLGWDDPMLIRSAQIALQRKKASL